MEKITEKIVRYFIILILMGIVFYSMTLLFQNQREVVTDNKRDSTDIQTDEIENPFVLKKHIAYGIRVGFTKEKIYELFPEEKIRPINLFIEGTPVPAIEISVDSEPSLIAELADGIVYRIRVLDSRFRTQEGIKIGSTLKELETAYQNIVYAPGEEAIFAMVRTLQMSFQLDFTDEIPPEWYKSHDRSLLDDSAVITKIVVF